MKKTLLFFILLFIPFIFFVPKSLAFNQDWTVSTNAITVGAGPYGTNGDIVASGHCGLTLQTSYGGYYVDSTSLCDGSGTAYFYSTFPDGTFYLSSTDNNGGEHDSNYFTIQNGLIVDDNATPDTKPVPNYPQTPDFTVSSGVMQLTTNIGSGLCDSIGWDVYDSNNEAIDHIDGCGGEGNLMNLQNSLPDGEFYVYGYIKNPDSLENNFLSFYSNKFFIEGGEFYSDSVVVSSIPDGTINRGDTYQQDSSFIDVNPSATSWTGTVDYGDGSGTQTLALNPDKTFSLNHQYNMPGTYTMTITINNDQGDTATETVANTVNPYVIQVNSPTFVSPVMENTYAPTVSFADSDPDATSWTATADYGDGSGTQSVTVNSDSTLSLNHVYNTVGSYNLTLTVTNNFGETGTSLMSIQVSAPFNASDVSFDSSTNTLTFTSNTDWSKVCSRKSGCGASVLKIYDSNNNLLFHDSWSPNSCLGNGVCTIQLTDFDANLLDSTQFYMFIQLFNNMSVNGSRTSFTASQLLPSNIFTQN